MYLIIPLSVLTQTGEYIDNLIYSLQVIIYTWICSYLVFHYHFITFWVFVKVPWVQAPRDAHCFFRWAERRGALSMCVVTQCQVMIQKAWRAWPWTIVDNMIVMFPACLKTSVVDFEKVYPTLHIFPWAIKTSCPAYPFFSHFYLVFWICCWICSCP
jgi:hypothetical protein